MDTIGGPGSGEGELDRPSGVAVDKDGDIYVVDWKAARLNIYDSEGTYLWKFLGDCERPSVWSQARIDSNLDITRARKRADISREKFFPCAGGGASGRRGPGHGPGVRGFPHPDIRQRAGLDRPPVQLVGDAPVWIFRRLGRHAVTGWRPYHRTYITLRRVRKILLTSQLVGISGHPLYRTLLIAHNRIVLGSPKAHFVQMEILGIFM